MSAQGVRITSEQEAPMSSLSLAQSLPNKDLLSPLSGSNPEVSKPSSGCSVQRVQRSLQTEGAEEGKPFRQRAALQPDRRKPVLFCRLGTGHRDTDEQQHWSLPRPLAGPHVPCQRLASCRSDCKFQLNFCTRQWGKKIRVATESPPFAH